MLLHECNNESVKVIIFDMVKVIISNQNREITLTKLIYIAVNQSAAL